MMRLPRFQFHAPQHVDEATDLLARHGSDALLVAGGTDVLPNMKRRQQMPTHLVSLNRIAALKAITPGDELTVGAGVTLTDLAVHPRVRREYRGLWQALTQIATPHLRNMGTIGGNLCLDTRCTYYDQSFEWRKAIGFCMKKDGDTCWVATSSPKCLAVSSTDAAPMLMALDATVTLTGATGSRAASVGDLYRNDGIDYMTRKPDEVLTSIHVPSRAGWRSTYWKLRRRGAIDFPVLSVAASVKCASDGTVEAARLVIGAVASQPLNGEAAANTLLGAPLTDAALERAGQLAAQLARPMDNTDFTLHWRKRMVSTFVGYALRELRGDDVRELRLKVSRQPVLCLDAATA